MTPARWPRWRRDGGRLLVLDPTSGQLGDRRLKDLPGLLAAGDLVVLNDAGTMPASLRARTRRGEDLELRLLAPAGGAWRAAVLGPGDWRTPTEARPAPPALGPGELLRVAGDLEVEVLRPLPGAPRVVELRFLAGSSQVWRTLYAQGRPVQYAYAADPLPLEAVQADFGGPPWASEMASAGRPLSWEVLLGLRRRGVGLATVTHAAGLSSIDGGAADAALPLPESSRVPAATAEAVRRTRAAGGRVLAVGTTVVRALEGRAAAGPLEAGEGPVDLVLSPESRPRWVDGVLSGIHTPEESHFRLLAAFAPWPRLEAAAAHAAADGYLGHEFGDSLLVLPGRAA